jgi:hypothetical protein
MFATCDPAGPLAFMKLIKAYVFAILMTGCLPAGGTYAGGTYGGTAGYASPAPVATTGVYVNGQELTVTDKSKLDWLLGYTLPAGNYYVTTDGMMGVVGQHATINLVAYAEARGLKPNQSSSHYNGYSGDAITTQGGCTIVSSGSMSYSSGC